MRHSDRVKLNFGPYRMPRVKLGQEVQCAIRGKVVVYRISKGRIPWPQCRPNIAGVLIVFDGLEKAIRQESAAAVAHWWGVTPETVKNWRRALGVEMYNAGTVKLRRAGYDDPQRSRKMRAAKLGKPRSEETKQKLRDAMNRFYGK